MSAGTSRIGVALCAIAVLFASVASGASILTPYNVIVSGNFTAYNSDIQGGAAIGGVYNSTDSVGGGLLNPSVAGEPVDPIANFPSSVTFIAAGIGSSNGNGLGATTATSLAAGNFSIAGTYHTSGGTDPLFYNNGGGASTTSPITSWTGTGSTFAAFQTQSNTFHGDTANVTEGGTGTNTITISASNTGMNVVYVPITDLDNGQTVTITNASLAKYLIVDVTGITAGSTYTLTGNITIDGAASNDIAAEDVLFNFYQPSAFTLDVAGTMIGSVLAPSAAVVGTCGGCTFNGSLVAASYSTAGSVQFHNFLFMGGATPEPAPFAVVGLSLLGLAYLRKRRRA